MTRLPQQLALTLAMVLAIAGATAPASLAESSKHPDTDPGVTYYLALGDSLSVGYQYPVETDRGYVDVLFKTLKQSQPSLQLKKLGCPGESTTTMIYGGCPGGTVYETGSQLGDAQKF
ncbi:MAG: hypothetical protein ABWZ98_11795, partial [Nakamurella sp.]